MENKSKNLTNTNSDFKKPPVLPPKPVAPPNLNATVNTAAPATEEKVPSKKQKEKSVKSKKASSNTPSAIKNDNVQPLTKKHKKISKKTVIFSVIALVLIAAIIITVFVIVKSNKKLTTPTVSIYAASNQTLVYVEPIEKVKSYDFYIQREGSAKVNLISSKTNEISLVSYLNTPGLYEIWARYVGLNANSTSNFSEKIEHSYYSTLTAPVVSVVNNDLVWAPVVNASQYIVYYSTGELDIKSKQVNINADYSNLRFSLNEIKDMPAGSYTMYVVAIGNEANFYKNSELSNSISYEYTKTLAAVTSASYNSENMMLTFTAAETLLKNTKFEIEINGVNYGYVSNADGKVFNVDLSPYLFDITAVETVRVLVAGDGGYLLNSEYTTAQIV